MVKQQISYDRVAKNYDFLSRLVFHKSQVRSQTEQLHFLKNCKNILIVGGGTGWILNDLNNIINPKTITFVETSVKMIELAKGVQTHHHIKFVHEDIEKFQTEISFDSILTPFLFDNFDEFKAKKVFEHLNQMLLKKGFWIYTDFRLDGTWWKKALLKGMHLFFRLINVVLVDSLPDIKHHFTENNYELIIDKYYYGGFIEARVYRKN